MSAPTALYWRAKADLCRELFIDQIQHNQEREAVRNLFRYSHALNMLEVAEEEGEMYECTDCKKIFHIDKGTYDKEWGFHCIYCGGLE